MCLYRAGTAATIQQTRAAVQHVPGLLQVDDLRLQREQRGVPTISDWNARAGDLALSRNAGSWLLLSERNS